MKSKRQTDSGLATYFPKGKFAARRVAEVLQKEHLFATVDRQLHRYEGGVWRNDGEEAIAVPIQNILGDRWTIHYQDEVVEFLRVRSKVAAFKSHDHLINTKDGMLDPITRDILPHDPSYDSVYQVPISYQQDIPGSLAEFYVRSVLPENTTPVFWEYIASCFIQRDYWPKSFLVLQGQSDTGKSKLLEWVRGIFGEENCTSLTLHSIADNRFSRHQLYHRIANIGSDLDSGMVKDIGLIKSLTGGDTIVAEEKGKPMYQFSNRARFFFSTNIFPSLRDTDEAFFKRILLIPCTNEFNQQQNEFYQQWYGSDILYQSALHCICEGYQRLIAQQALSESATIMVARAHLSSLADTVIAFLMSCEANQEACVPQNVMYQWYRRFCEMEGAQAVSGAVFYRKMAEAIKQSFYGVSMVRPRTGEEMTRPRHYKGLKPCDMP